ncbi:MAG: YihY/virulence factor BrkB family protein [Fimbriimonadaceae bacterium]|nr:YihY/virulence factor BrkB family protein [Fimbriimonadaceae bacterium]
MSVADHPLVGVFLDAGEGYGRHRANRMAAAFTFYTLLSISPLLLVAIGVGSMFMDEATVRNAVLEMVSESFGKAQSDFLHTLIVQTASQHTGLAATLISLPVMLWGASAMFGHLHEATNVIWGSFDRRGGLKGFALQRLAAIVIVLLMGVILVAWMSLDAALAVAVSHARTYLDPSFPLYRGVSFLAGLAFWGVVFALFLRALPAPALRFKDVALGASVVSFGFGVGRHLVSLYFQYSNFSAAYGAAGAVVALLLWTYFSASLFFFGVELSRAYAYRHGSLREEEESE